MMIFLWLLFSIVGSFHCKDLALNQLQPAGKDSALTVLSPFWSPAGDKILFFGTTFGSEGYGLYEVDSNGGKARLRMLDSIAKGSPALSPDGKTIAYLGARPGRLLCCAHAWVMNVDGTGARDLTPFFSNWENLRWSPDSRTIVFDGLFQDSGVVNYHLVTVNIVTGELRQLTRGNFGNRDPSYLANGRKIVWLSGKISTDYGGKIFFMNSDGTDAVPLDTTSTASAYPRPSPVHNEVIFSWGLGEEADAGTFLIDLDSVPLPAERRSFRQVFPGAELNMMQWSPDGNFILLTIAGSFASTDLYLMGRQFNPLVRLTSGLNVSLFSYAWSPDSRYLVFNATDSSSTTIHTYTYDTRIHMIRKLRIY